MALEGQHLGRYRIVRLLGSGGMGEVYLAEDPRIGQKVAIKVVRADLDAYPGPQTNDEAARLFLREAQAIVALDHPAILPLHEYGETQIGQMRLTFLVMPYRKEGSLAAWVRRQASDGILPPSVVAHLVSEAAEALQHAHDHGIVHQDIKPANFLLRARAPGATLPDVLLADFGIARLTAATANTSQAIRGTPTYMAPEQCLGKPVMASDQYALAIMAYELLTGRPPFQGSPMQIMFQHVNTLPEAPSIHHPRLSHGVDAVLLKGLSKRPEERFSSVTAFAAAFQDAVQALETEGAETRISAESSPKITNALPDPPLISDTMANAPTYISPPVEASAPPVSRSLAEEAPTPAAQGWAAASTGPTALPLPETIDLGKRPEREASAPAAPGWTEDAETPTAPPLADTLSQDAGDAAGAPEGAVGAEQAGPVVALAAPVGPIPEGARRHGGKRRFILIAATVLVVLALVGSGLAYGLLGATATVTITPASQEVSNVYTFSAEPGTPDASKQEVGARMLSVTTPTQTKTATATGHATLSATQAHGTLVVENNATLGVTFTAGTTFPNNAGNGCTHPQIEMVLDTTVTLPPGGRAGDPVVVAFAPGHVLQAGSIGNVIASDTCGSGSPFDWYGNDGSCVPADTVPPCWYVFPRYNFTGGRDAYNGPVVKQSDIDGAENSLISANQPDPQQILQAQMQQGEQLVGTPQCTPKKSANHKAGDKAPAVTVSVSFLCTGEVYDHDGAAQMAASLLIQQAATDLGEEYTLMGTIKTAITAVPADELGTVTLTVNAEGVWTHQFSGAQLQALARVIAGKRAQDAQRILTSQPGVSQAAIKLSGGFGQTLPSDPARIRIVLQEPGV